MTPIDAGGFGPLSAGLTGFTGAAPGVGAADGLLAVRGVGVSVGAGRLRLRGLPPQRGRAGHVAGSRTPRGGCTHYPTGAAARPPRRPREPAPPRPGVGADRRSRRGRTRGLGARPTMGDRDPIPRIELGHAYELRHEYEKALEMYDRAAEVAKADPRGPREGGMRAARGARLAGRARGSKKP